MRILLCLVIATVSFGACNPSTINDASLASFDFAQMDVAPYSSMGMVVMPRDQGGHLVKVNGKLSVEIWDEIPINDSEANPVQHWDDVPVAKENFRNGIGNYITLEYKNFTPEPEKSYYIIVTMTVDDAILTAERSVYLIPPPE